MSERVRLAIGTATTGLCRIEWTESLVELIQELERDRPKNGTLKVEAFKLLYYCSSVIPENRNQVVKMAQEWKATHLLWVDDDMSFSPEVVKAVLGAWLALKKEMKADRPRILGANCIKRLYPLQYMAVSFDDREVLSYASKGITQVKYTGNAFLLTEMEIYSKIEEPWFAFPWVQETKSTGTEDVFFMQRALEAGFGTFVIHELGEHIDHTGSWTFKPSDRYMPKDRFGGWRHPDVPAGVRSGGPTVGYLPVEGGRVPDESPPVQA